MNPWVTVIGRGHSGTRAMSQTLAEGGVFMGAPLNPSWDLVPPEDMYEACRVMARHVAYLGHNRWDFSKLHTMPIDPAFTRLIESFLASVVASDAPRKGWKIPETTLVFPWIVRLRFAAHAFSNCSFNAARLSASGTGVRQLRRNQPNSPSTPPFSFPLAGLQYSL